MNGGLPASVTLAVPNCQERRCHNMDAIRLLIGAQALGQSSPDTLEIGSVQRGSPPACSGASDVLPVVLEVVVPEGLGVGNDPNIGEARPCESTHKVIGFAERL